MAISSTTAACRPRSGRRSWPGSTRARPLGDPKDLPAARTFPEGWTIGKPDVVFELPETYYVPAQGVVSYVYFRVPTNFKEDMWVQAAEAVPGDRSVVHHIIVYVMDPRRTKGGGAGPMHFCGYAPGDAPSVFPEGTAKRIPAGADLLFQVHYTPNGRVRTDRSKVGFVFAKTKPTREAFTIGIANPDLLLPAHARQRRSSPPRWSLPGDARLLSLLPHMHLRGKDFKFTITKPGESPQVVLSVPAYDFGWQTYYVLAEPMNPAQGDPDRLPGPLRQLGRQPVQPRPEQDGPLGRADVRGDDDRLSRHGRAGRRHRS